jgi:glycine/D-amino acid oxidase-like deaminating enzyme/nitrite reductase/ring-hydroxylating ferredoxin subunit
MSAYLLAKAGKSVIVLDEKPIGGGETGRTSAHLASAIDDRFLEIEKNRGVEAAMVQYESHAAGIDLIERIVSEHRIDCDFSRVDGYLFAGEGHDREFLERECDAARRAGCADAGLLDRAPVTGFASGACVRFPRQGRFHPLRYLIGLADVLRAMGVRIHCGARVCDLAGDGPVIAKVDGGPVVRADFGIAATNVPTPINNWMGIYTKQASYRSYVIAMEVARGAVSDALYWDTLDPYHYVRVVDSDDAEHKSLLIVGGEDHRVGTHGTLDEGIQCFERLERWARERFCRGLGDDAGLGRVVARWSGQVAEPDDGVAFIGRVPTRTHQACFVITGDSGMGLTGGALGAILVSELILKGGGEKADRDVHPWAGLYDPARKPTTSLQGAVEFVKENAAAAATMVEYLTPGDVDSVEKIAPGTGAVVRDGMSKVAAYRDEEGTLHRCSAICPHLKCIVQWNGLEKSWDCPCHGSRFDAKGKLIMGPAIDNLPVIENEK